MLLECLGDTRLSDKYGVAQVVEMFPEHTTTVVGQDVSESALQLQIQLLCRACQERYLCICTY